jgi:hypothetical protein
MYLDVKTHLVVRTDDQRTMDGHDVDFVTEVGDYRPVGGLVFPHRIEVGPKGSPDRQKLTIAKIEIDPVLDDARFSPPPPARPAPSVLP